jgi:poly [ADP-ribose] polymerase 6/8
MEMTKRRHQIIGHQKVFLKFSDRLGEDWILNVLDYIKKRIQNCTQTCIICDGPLPFEMIKPAVCGKNLCVHSHEQYGLGADVASEIRDNPDVVDFLICLCYAISQGDFRRFNPYPLGVEYKSLDEHGKEVIRHFMTEDGITRNPLQVKAILDKLPSIKDMSTWTDTRSIKQHLDTTDPLCFPLLRWIITSNRAHLARLKNQEMIKEMNTEYQYMFLSSPPEKEHIFQKLKKEKGSFWAFHGSNFANWHSILRIGLKNYSNTELMTTGAAYGAGIYLCTYTYSTNC